MSSDHKMVGVMWKKKMDRGGSFWIGSVMGWGATQSVGLESS
jgi:hypothetical protein